MADLLDELEDDEPEGVEVVRADENPFSFRKFAGLEDSNPGSGEASLATQAPGKPTLQPTKTSAQTKPQSKKLLFEDSESDDETSIPGLSTARHGVPANGQQSGQKKTEATENPFSFTAFVQKSATVTTSSAIAPTPSPTVATTRAKSSASATPSSQGSSSTSTRIVSNSSGSVNHDQSSAPVLPKNSKPQATFKEDISDDDDNDSFAESPPPSAAVPTTLPDVDAASPAEAKAPKRRSSSSGVASRVREKIAGLEREVAERSAELVQVKDKSRTVITDLRAKIKQLQTEAQAQKERADAAEARLRRKEKKDAEELQAMQQFASAAESNLAASVQRAVDAESRAAALEAELYAARQGLPTPAMEYLHHVCQQLEQMGQEAATELRCVVCTPCSLATSPLQWLLT
ncbi:uncharacterized protein MONBRDRAFT_29169 [Monosiga brevicollis MX1]|uniref:Uncharacterized protein n=1 Tax=Monosiga brevicollis TaxID=81824 RepID=A9VAB3_MONBE|nr:uncharacterized protein MONBRDRAFT_29169 [Monosiga brevicollis MX1]EDQ85510.1 predicted protein [Monosiga brevicollis MX1]|eukprot:XP_001749701.1 hypothetical protein [Monosiga brevicollis MX1]